MSGIVDLAAARAAREEPDANCIFSDDFGRPMQLYALGYAMNGKAWAAQILAYSMEDAEARVSAIRASLELQGQIQGTGMS